jgi:hypothetical protein
MYGNTQLEALRREARLMYVCNRLGPERELRRAMRTKPGQVSIKLRKHTRSLGQLEQYGHDLVNSCKGQTATLWNDAGTAFAKEAKELKATFRAKAEWNEQCMICGETAPDGTPPLMCCEGCMHAAHLRCTELSKEPDEWLCGECADDNGDCGHE